MNMQKKEDILSSCIQVTLTGLRGLLASYREVLFLLESLSGYVHNGGVSNPDMS